MFAPFTFLPFTGARDIEFIAKLSIFTYFHFHHIFQTQDNDLNFQQLLTVCRPITK